MYYSPLRYPGGKRKLALFMEYMIDKLGHRGGTYIEPFAGGAGIAIELLERNVVENIVINDYDKGVWSFWKAVLTDTDKLVEMIEHVPLTMDEWKKQRCIVSNTNNYRRYSFELGFATFFMNRTNRSGIIKGGVIGGLEQSGKWKLDVRFNKGELIRRIRNIAKRKRHIRLYNKDIGSFIKNILPRCTDNAFVYFDPPYFGKGKQLYMNYFSYDDHFEIEQLIRNYVNVDWIITYDVAPEIIKIYERYPSCLYDLNYSVSKKCKNSEMMIFKKYENVPDNNQLLERGIVINLRKQLEQYNQCIEDNFWNY
ncbi:MAG: DNA adenine methylase [Selenomonadaceae bacterium]|nr:DNA adenine methylase [Selenomonadaceae bacterium]